MTNSELITRLDGVETTEPSPLDDFVMVAEQMAGWSCDMGSMPIRKAMRPGDEPAAYHPERRDEPVLWWTYDSLIPDEEFPGEAFYTKDFYLVVKMSFVQECIDGIGIRSLVDALMHHTPCYTL